MRPIVMAGLAARLPLSFSPTPGGYSASNYGTVEFTISASSPVVWNWSSTGSIPWSTVQNGASAAAITFGLNAPPSADRSSTITVTVGGNSWTIDLTAIHNSGSFL